MKRGRIALPVSRWLRLAGASAIAFVIAALVAAHPVLAAKSASIVIDAYSGEILHQSNADGRVYPASLTKMMTLYLLFDALDSGKLKLQQGLVISKRAAGQPATRLGLRSGQKILVEQAIYALIIRSANDVATVVAEALGGRLALSSCAERP